MGTPDLLVPKIASAQPVCFIICGKEIRLKRNMKGESELRKIGNRAHVILIVIKKRASLPNLGIMCSNRASVPQTVWSMIIAFSQMDLWVVYVNLTFSVIIKVSKKDRKNNNAAPTNTINSGRCWVVLFPSRTWQDGVWDDGGKWIQMYIN